MHRLVIALLAVVASSLAQEFRLVKSLSGPSGKVDGAKFVFDETRSRFIYPQDKAFIAYFEWEGPAGTHALTGLWKQPDSRVASISPDVRIVTSTREMACYWTYTLYPEMAPGVWTLEIRINGQPSGSHSFEIVGTGTTPEKPPAEVAPKPPSVDDIFRAVMPALVSIRRFDADGKRIDTALGFVIQKDRIATAFQAVDGASKLELEFAGGQRVRTEEILAWSRVGDWAVIAANSGDSSVLQQGDPTSVGVGERLIVFNVEGGSKVIGGVDISGKRSVAGYGERIQFSPSIASEAAGGPVLDSQGRVMGILGGSVTPGARFVPERMSISPALGISTHSLNAVTPVSAIPKQLPDKPTSLGVLVSSGVLTAPLSEMAGLLYVGTASEPIKQASDPLPRDVCEFSKRDKQVWVISEWLKKGKVSRGMFSAKVYDEQNRIRVAVQPKKISLSSTPARSGFSFEPATLTPGLHRIDLFWDERPVWRTFIRVND